MIHPRNGISLRWKRVIGIDGWLRGMKLFTIVRIRGLVLVIRLKLPVEDLFMNCSKSMAFIDRCCQLILSLHTNVMQMFFRFLTGDHRFGLFASTRWEKLVLRKLNSQHGWRPSNNHTGSEEKKRLNSQVSKHNETDFSVLFLLDTAESEMKSLRQSNAYSYELPYFFFFFSF